jgi:hypothetical protein
MRGDNLEQELNLRLVNHGTRAEPEFIDVPKKQDVAVPSQAYEGED